ncbi:hypothetical protein CLOP_g22019 [Closterium sp. NIES-67]|nr:hypothetical protein CLOP_g22019 [Closterium sp. NIES-67]
MGDGKPLARHFGGRQTTCMPLWGVANHSHATLGGGWQTTRMPPTGGANHSHTTLGGLANHSHATLGGLANQSHAIQGGGIPLARHSRGVMGF